MNLIFNFDQLIYHGILLVQRNWLTPLMIGITDLLSPVTLPIFAVLLIIWLIYKKQTAKAILTIVSLGGGFLLETGLKIIIARPRPPIGLVTETDYSFPSGHATLAIIFFALMIYCFKDYFKTKIGRWLYILINILLCLLVGFSRLYLGVHWFSDVIGGYVIGILWLAVVFLLLRKKISK